MRFYLLSLSVADFIQQCLWTAHMRMFQWPIIDPTKASLRLTANKKEASQGAHVTHSSGNTEPWTYIIE